MELSLGTEPGAGYLSFEVARAARKLVEEVMLVKAGEQVLVTVDTAGDRRVAEAVAQAKGVPPDRLASITTENARRLFRLP